MKKWMNKFMKIINTLKINFIYFPNSGNKVDIDYKEKAEVSKIWYSSWIVDDSLNFLS